MGVFQMIKSLIQKLSKSKPNQETSSDTKHLDDWGLVREVELFPYFVYSNTENKIIGSIYLTAQQAYDLNKFMKRKADNPEGIAFLRK